MQYNLRHSAEIAQKAGNSVFQKLARQVTWTYSTFQAIHMDFQFLVPTILVPHLSHLKYQSRGMTTKFMLNHAYSYVQDDMDNGGQIKATVNCQI